MPRKNFPLLSLTTLLAMMASSTFSFGQTTIPQLQSPGNQKTANFRAGSLPAVLEDTVSKTYPSIFLTTGGSRRALSSGDREIERFDFDAWLPRDLERLPGTALGYAYIRQDPRPGDQRVEHAYWASADLFDFWIASSIQNENRDRQQAFARKHRTRYRDLNDRARSERWEAEYER